MKRKVGILTLFCFLFNGSALMAVVEVGSVGPLSRVSAPVYGALAQAGQLINSVKELVNNAVPLFPEYKPAKKQIGNKDLNPPIIASMFSNLQKPFKNSSKMLIAGQHGFQQGGLSATEADVGKSQAPPGVGWLTLLVLMFIVSLHRSNLPAVIALSARLRRARIHPIA